MSDRHGTSQPVAAAVLRLEVAVLGNVAPEPSFEVPAAGLADEGHGKQLAVAGGGGRTGTTPEGAHGVQQVVHAARDPPADVVDADVIDVG
jgi:hypothetical protein